MAEERTFERFEFPVQIEYSVPGKDWIKGEATAKNISLGGVQFLTKEKINLGSRVALRIALPHRGRATTATGELVWFKESRASGKGFFQVGVRFTQADPFDLEELLKGAVPFFHRAGSFQ